MKTVQDRNMNVTTGAKFPIKEWTVGVEVEEGARKQLINVANLPFIHKHVAAENLQAFEQYLDSFLVLENSLLHT